MVAKAVDLLGAGADAAEDILRDVYRVEKVLDPLDPRDFLSIVRRLSRAVRGVARPAEDDALRRALERLDVDWPNLAPVARDQVVRAARQALGTVEAQVLPRVDQLFEAEAARVVGGTRRSTVRRFGLRIGADLSRTDERIAKFVRESQGNFIRDEYGRRREDFTRRAKGIVASGVERGLGRDEIVTELSGAMARDAFDRSRDYWEVVSTVFANRARTFSQVNAYDEAGIERYRWEAVLDEVSCDRCRFMHGRTFTVGGALERFRKVERLRDPEGIRNVQPFLQVGSDDEGRRVLFFERGDRRRAVAEVTDSAEGERDDVGRYARALDSQRLEAAGIGQPPAHGRCRCVTVPEV
jgi:hypothetical protein